MNPYLAKALANQHTQVKAKKPRTKTTAHAAEEKAEKSAEPDTTTPSKEK
jgi:hypothetical protein